jgi:penicillin-binding protein 1A
MTDLPSEPRLPREPPEPAPAPEPNDEGELAPALFERIRRAPLWVWAASFFGGLVLLASLVFVILFSIYSPGVTPGTDIASFNKLPSISFADADGKVFANRGAAFGAKVAVAAMPSYLPAAFLVIEDRRFYDHWGVDLRGVLRAFWSNVEAGDIVQGGSTITQQLAKNVFLKPERTFSRKLEEMFIAFWLERHYSKADILAHYLNRIYLGSGTYGVDAAARQYFGKPAGKVTLAEAAMLASLTRAPSRYTPEADLEAAQARAARVLDLLVEDGKIKAEDADKAKKHPAKLVIREDIDSENYFADFALDQMTKLGVTSASDLIVRTTIVRKLQSEAQRAVTTVLNRDGPKRSVGQGAMISMEPDGAVRALVGGRSYNESSFNRAFQAQRQPGSAFKPVVYLAALEKGMSPDTVRDDEPYEDNGWTPTNYDGNYSGQVSLREALARSINTVAVRVADEVGRNAIIRVAQRLGVQSPLEPNRSLPLGTSEVNLLELTGVFAAFANGGYGVEPYAITEISTSEGLLLYRRPVKERRQVMSQTQAEEMNQMLFEVVQTGTGKNADLGARPAGAKTGTTQDHRDAWFIGYTADYVTGVWIGNDDNSPTKRVAGGGLPASIWKSYMVAAHKGLPVRTLPGVDLYDNSERDYYTYSRPAPPEEQNPYGERGAPYVRRPPPPDTPGLVDRFFDELFGGGEYPEDNVPPPHNGPYRQPEPEEE